jgi:alanine racemase
MAVIKADAYGHGHVQVARMLADMGVGLFAVSNIDEAVGLREAGISGEILILGYSSPVYAQTLYDLNLTQTLVSETYAEQLAKTGYRVKCQWAIDTGMNRIGINANNLNHCEQMIRTYAERLDLNGIFTHLCVADSSDEEDKIFTRNQIEKFKLLADRVADLKLPYVHCCNSAGGLSYIDNTEYYDTIGRIVRLGIVLYGLKPDYSNPLPQGIAPALTWKSVISMVKPVAKGEFIGYGRSFEVKRDSIIATVATGYADGLSRLLADKGFVMINGHQAPIVGRICMDQTLIDVTDIPNVCMGMSVTLLGKNGDLVYTADDMAQDLGTIGYEVMCNITKRVQRFYVNSYQDYL